MNAVPGASRRRWISAACPAFIAIIENVQQLFTPIDSENPIQAKIALSLAEMAVCA
jgi:hypothetical protein